jgi:5-methylcytosine-specific restriction endonuclease McrBC regulatory subunit McrC
MRVETLRESHAAELILSAEEAEGLLSLGRKLASDKSWWGTNATDEEDSDSAAVIRCDHAGDGRWRITVDNAVGSVTTGDVHLIVQPKIPSSHLLYLFSKTDAWPRLDEASAPLLADATFIELIALWYLNAMETLLRSELLRDYREDKDELEAVRGRIDVLATTQLIYSGRLAATCDFEVFDVDTPLNRVLKAAARAILRVPVFSGQSRRRAERVALRMDEVGPLRLDDLAVTQLERRTASYREALLLAKNLLRLEGRTLAAGDVVARSFLIRTPELVEDGIRSILAGGLQGRCVVTKKGKKLGQSTLTINPDLQFGDFAVGDVKYKLNWNAWPRSDTYQSVAFAAGFRRDHAVIVNFCSDQRPNLPLVSFGEINVSHLQWRATLNSAPVAAEELLVADAKNWWDTRDASLSWLDSMAS